LPYVSTGRDGKLLAQTFPWLLWGRP